MKTKIGLIFFMIFALSSCGELEEESVTVEKQDFLINTKLFQDFTTDSVISKSAKLSSSQDIMISSNAVGRVGKIYLKEGDRVYKGQTLATLEDNIGSYGISLNRASNSIERAQINYDSTKLSLDKAISDTELSLNQLQFNLESLKKEKVETLKTAKLDLDNSDYSTLDSKSALEIEKLDSSISKLELDYETTLINNFETIEGFKTTLKKEYNSLIILQNDVIELGDKLFGLTSKYRKDANKIKDYFGGRNAIEKAQTKSSLLALIAFKDGQLSNLDLDSLENEQILSNVDLFLEGYDLTKDFLNLLQSTLNNSITSVGTLGDTDIATYLASVNGYQSSSQASYSVLIVFSSSSNSFLRTYEKTQESLDRQLGLLKKDREIFIKGLNTGGVGAEVGYEKILLSYNDRIKNLETQIEITKSNLDNAKKSKEVTLKSLTNGIKEAQIGYSSAAKEYSKLTISSPISGTVGKVFVDEGQEVGVGVVAFSVTNIGSPEISFSFSKDELELIEVGQDVFLARGDESYTGTLVSVSDIADNNLKYKAVTTFDVGLENLGDIVKIQIPVNSEFPLLPLNSIIKQSMTQKGTEDLGKLYFLEGDELKSMNVLLGNIFYDKAEILGCVIDGMDTECTDKNIILSDMSQYDKNKFKLVENEK